MKYFKTLILSISFLALPIVRVVANTGSTGGNTSGTGSTGGNPSGAGSTGGNPLSGGGGVSLNNPLASDNIIDFLLSLLDVIMIFAVPLIVFMIIYAGFTYVMARGNPGEVGRASRTLLYAVIGGVIILGAQVLLMVIQGTVDAFR